MKDNLDVIVEPRNGRFFCSLCQHWIWATYDRPELEVIEKRFKILPDNFVIEAAQEHQGIHIKSRQDKW